MCLPRDCCLVNIMVTASCLIIYIYNSNGNGKKLDFTVILRNSKHNLSSSAIVDLIWYSLIGNININGEQGNVVDQNDFKCLG